MCYPSFMPVSVFENSRDEALIFILEPNEERYELAPHAKIGVKYSFEAEAGDRTFAEFGEGTIRFWCDSKQRDVEIISPSRFDLLLWDICVGNGFCGGIVDDQPTHVTDLLPASGTITADEFARLVIRAEGGGGEQPYKVESCTEQLKAKFIENMGSSEVAAEEIQQNFIQPFDSDYK